MQKEQKETKEDKEWLRMDHIKNKEKMTNLKNRRDPFLFIIYAHNILIPAKTT